MITGVFNEREARVPLVVRGPGGQSQGVAAIIDTGFSGHLTLPLAIIEVLGLDHLGQGRALVGDGSIQVFDLYEAVLIWDQEPLTVYPEGTFPPGLPFVPFPSTVVAAARGHPAGRGNAEYKVPAAPRPSDQPDSRRVRRLAT